MNTYYGIGVGSGSVSGVMFIYDSNRDIPEKHNISDIESEKSRFRLAKFIALTELSRLYDRALSELGERAAMRFHVHKIMLTDDIFSEMVLTAIEKSKTDAEYAVYESAKNLSGVFDDLDDKDIRERCEDIWDIARQLIAILRSDSSSYPILTEPSIIIAKDLSPSELLLPEKKFIVAVVLSEGSDTSDTAILARKMNIPMIVNVDFNGDKPESGYLSIADADKGAFMT